MDNRKKCRSVSAFGVEGLCAERSVHESRKYSGSGRLVIEEEVLPVGQTACVIGTYEQKRNGMSARRSRMGPNLFIYQGHAEEVLARVGKETAVFAKVVAVLLSIGVLLVGTAFLPAIASS